LEENEMNSGYLIYQTERARTPAEQREIDERNGELAAAIAKWLLGLRARVGGLHGSSRA
jgi:hypothetical protein